VARWHFLGSWEREFAGKPLTNARAETICEKPTFRAAFARDRCLFPAEYWLEAVGPKGNKTWCRHGRADGEPFYLAGLWASRVVAEQRVNVACIITTAANERAAELHDRMPLVLAEGDEEAWLDPATPLEIVSGLLQPADPSWLLITPDDAPPRRRAVAQTTLEI
jgi:putative SOS response-associated peptidase YedK